MSDITAIILTKNEEKNIADCINSIARFVKRIVVIDSFSTDNTIEIARKMGADVFQHTFINHSQQFIWGETTCQVDTAWTLRIDADERISAEAAEEIISICDDPKKKYNGIIVRFTVEFLGRQLKHGGIYPFKKLILYRTGKGKMEDRNMDEHIVLLEGKAIELKNDSYHHDYKNLSAWIEKHNTYSDKEVIDYFNNDKDIENLHGIAKLKRWIKFNIYYHFPMGTRAWLYYVYRYYIRLGFLDGKEGKIFAFLQAYWYRFLVDSKIYEAESISDYEN